MSVGADDAKPRPELHFRLAIVTGFLLLAIAGVTALIMAFSTAEVGQLSGHSSRVLREQAALFSAVQDAETGQRGYLLTQDLAYLAPFKAAEQRLPGIISDLAKLVSDNPDQTHRLAMLKVDIDRKMHDLDDIVSATQAGAPARALALVKTNEGRNLMVRIRQDIAELDSAEERLLVYRQQQARRQRFALAVVISSALLLAALLALGVAAEVRRHTREIVSHNEALKREKDEHERTESLLRQAQKMEALGQLTGGVAHDFNNMLAIIVGNLDLASRRLADGDPRLVRLVENALAGANRAAALTKRLLAFSRLQPLEPRPTDVNKCVADISEVLRRSLGEDVAIETVLGGGAWHAFVDAPQLESAILNLAVNARDAMDGKGRLTLETANTSLDASYADGHEEVIPGQYIMLAITDTGSGMTPEVMSRAFDPFFTTKKVGEGTGLGLSQVHGFLKQSRGHIKLYSEPGVGTTVKLYLPRDTSGVISIEPPPERAASHAPGDITVLVVEDEPGVRTFVAGAVKELGFRVLEADTAAEALEALEQDQSVRVLLTDVIMPGATGRQLVDCVLPTRPDLKVIYMTGYTRNAIVHNGMLDPGTKLLTKPFTIGDLDRVLRDVISD